MSFSATVDYRYRLVAADLAGRPRRVMVTRVSYQGVENLQAMLHFEGVPKPLALDPNQRLVVAQIARSTAVADWVGLMIELRPVLRDGREVIEIWAPNDAQQPMRMPPPPRTQARVAVEAKVSAEQQGVARQVELGQSQAQWFGVDVPETSIWTPILLGVLLVCAFFAVYLLETDEAAWQWLGQWLG